MGATGPESQIMTKVAFVVLALASSTTFGWAADLKVSTTAPAAPAVASPWDIAFGAGLMSDYNFRGITQSNHKPSAAAYFEPRYSFSNSLQGYVGVSGESISFPNRAAAEVDFYAGIRPTFGKLALDFGVWEYWYPGGECFNAVLPGDCAANGNLPVNGNVVKADLSFWEAYGKATYAFSDAFAAGASAFYSPSVLNSGADGTYLAGTARYTFPAPFLFLPSSVGVFVSADIGHWFLGTTDAFYGVLPAFPNGIPYRSYTNWDVGLGLTYKQFTLDLRYYGTDLGKGDCNAFTTAQNAGGVSNVTTINPGGAGTNWCGAAFIAKLSVDLTAANLK
jgi:uncharacterized protein (TIGR02001 family)